MDKINKYIHVITLGLVILLFIGCLFLWNRLENQNAKYKNYENTIAAINGQMTTTIKNGVETVTKASPEIDIDQLTKSEYFKTLSKNQQDFYNQLAQVKGLVSATNVKLEKHGKMIDSLVAMQNGGVVKNDTLEFKRGSIITFNEKDSTKKLQWTAKLKLDSILKLNVDYKYNVSIQTNFVRQKDKTILVKYMINDPELKVDSMLNFIIPQEQPKTALGRWIQKNQKPLKIIGGCILFFGGVAVGTHL